VTFDLMDNMVWPVHNAGTGWVEELQRKKILRGERGGWREQALCEEERWP